MSVSPIKLPYAYNALEPHMSEKTLHFHYDKHHLGYAKKVNAAIQETPLEGKPLEEIIEAAAADADSKALFNNAAQVWNHNLFWQSMSPNGGGRPGDSLAEMIGEAFGDYEKFRETFIETGTKRFGSGYVWLVVESGKLRAISTPNAATPLLQDGMGPLSCCDVWEHAYYLDFQNKRGEFLETFIDNLIDWEAAESRLANAPREALKKIA